MSKTIEAIQIKLVRCLTHLREYNIEKLIQINNGWRQETTAADAPSTGQVYYMSEIEEGFDRGDRPLRDLLMAANDGEFNPYHEFYTEDEDGKFVSLSLRDVENLIPVLDLTAFWTADMEFITGEKEAIDIFDEKLNLSSVYNWNAFDVDESELLCHTFHTCVAEEGEPETLLLRHLASLKATSTDKWLSIVNNYLEWKERIYPMHRIAEFLEWGDYHSHRVDLLSLLQLVAQGKFDPFADYFREDKDGKLITMTAKEATEHVSVIVIAMHCVANRDALNDATIDKKVLAKMTPYTFDLGGKK